MSTEEKKRREEYRKRRNLLIIIQAAIMFVISLTFILCCSKYSQYNKDYYLKYTESSSVDYRVYLKDNSFYEEEYLPSNQSYITDLVDYIEIDFINGISFLNTEVNNNFVYKSQAHLEVNLGQNGSSSLLYKHYNEDDIVNITESNNINGNYFTFKKTVKIDYNYYNDKAKSYMDTYNPSGALCVLVVDFNIISTIKCESFVSDETKALNVSVRIPLNVGTINKIEVKGLASSNGEYNILKVVDRSHLTLFKVLMIVSGVIDLLLIAGLIVFIYITRNSDINYTVKVNKTVNLYKSFIQKIVNKFDTEEYQILYVETIKELLEIRDTLQIPVLMYENEDKTCCQFMVPANNKMLYMFEIKVDNFEELYKDDVVEE